MSKQMSEKKRKKRSKAETLYYICIATVYKGKIPLKELLKRPISDRG